MSQQFIYFSLIKKQEVSWKVKLRFHHSNLQQMIILLHVLEDIRNLSKKLLLFFKGLEGERCHEISVGMKNMSVLCDQSEALRPVVFELGNSWIMRDLYDVKS